ncbi:hypothetical protein PRIPAC_89674 [Pristionchus pacificus]|uniref:Peptidase n=1 Tax=Pristionchus pacificus TaxID=54126 RepID=A0A454Y6S1_PRIPA|nr:hypothetical protein PRIPAC_89674 [Pristionchus pacificus]|eukprot:PDM62582.1 Peptidase [Pristionchus pacificus]
MPHHGWLLAVAALCLLHNGQASMYKGYKLIRFEANETVAEWLETMSDVAHDYDEKRGEERRILFDVFSEPSKIQSHADVLVAPDFLEAFLLMLRKQGVEKVIVLKKDMQKLIDEEEYTIDNRRRRRKRAGNVVDDFDAETYHEYAVMTRFMHDLALHHPTLVKVVNVSRSTENRQIIGVKISTSSIYKPAIVIDAGVHAREWVAPAVAMYIMKKLVKSAGHDHRLSKALIDFDWFIIPQVNPDGYEYSRNTDRLWRKTRSRFNGSRYCLGTDANRNWGFQWGKAGANRSPCSNIYQGAHPFSEPEIEGLKNFLTFEIPDLTIYLSLHSYGQQEAAHKAVSAIRKTSGANYTYGTIAEVMYPASGTSIDYLQDKGVPYIYGVELRPQDSTDSYGFNIPAKFIKPTGDEMLEGILAISEHALLKKKIRL